MPYSTLPVAANGGTIASSHVNVLGSNDVWFTGLLQSPQQAGQVPISLGTTSGQYGYLSGSHISNSAVGSLQLATLTIGSNQLGSGIITSALLASTLLQQLVTSGICAWFQSAADIATAWTRETAVNDRFVVGAGTVFSSTLAENTNYGTVWTHGHTMSFNSGTWTSGGNDLSISHSTPDVRAAYPTHYHVVNAPTEDETWMPPSRAYVVARKD